MRFQWRVSVLLGAALIIYLMLLHHRLRIIGSIDRGESTWHGLNLSACNEEDNESISPLPPPNGHRLGVVVPFRNREKELLQFVPMLNQFLKEQEIDHIFVVVNQQDGYRFNRGVLLNIGTLVALHHQCDYVALHDVDLLPLQPELDYRFPKRGPYHVSAPGLHPKYKFRKFLGGIVLMRMQDMFATNGFSTRFWGWGKEDDDFRRRIVDYAGLDIARPPPLRSGMKHSFLHLHREEADGNRDKVRHSGQERLFNVTDPVEGLNTTRLAMGCVVPRVVAGVPVMFVNVQLMCNQSDTPWCVYLDSQQGAGEPVTVAGQGAQAAEGSFVLRQENVSRENDGGG